MEIREIKRDDLIIDFSGMADIQKKHFASVNALRRKMYLELEKIEGVRTIFDKYNVFFVEGFDDLNRINIDWPVNG